MIPLQTRWGGLSPNAIILLLSHGTTKSRDPGYLDKNPPSELAKGLKVVDYLPNDGRQLLLAHHDAEDNPVANMYLAGTLGQCGMALLYGINFNRDGNAEIFSNTLKQAIEILIYCGYTNVMVTLSNGQQEHIKEMFLKHGFKVIDEFVNARTSNRCWVLTKNIQQ